MIAITGASGLLGRFIAQCFISSGVPLYGIARSATHAASSFPEVSWKESDILDVVSLTKALEGAEMVIHSAALVSFNAKDKERLFKINVEGTRNVVNACLAVGVKRLIHVSSIAALGRQKGTKLVDENSKWVESNLNTDYAESKYLAELEVYRGQEEGLQIDIVNPSVILSRSDWSRSSAQLFRYVWQQRKFYTDGTVNYVDVRDVAGAVLSIANQPSTGQRFIVNAGNISLIELMRGIGKYLEKKPPSILVPRSLISIAARLEYLRTLLTGSEPMVTPQTARAIGEKIEYSSSRLQSKFGISFRELDETLQWCCSYYREQPTINN